MSDVNNNIEFNYFACIFPVFTGVISNRFKCLLPPESLLNGIMLRQDEVNVLVVAVTRWLVGKRIIRIYLLGKPKGVRRPNFQRNLFISAIRNKN